MTGPLDLRRLFGSLTYLLLPPVCIVCRGRIGGHGLLCAGCWAKIDFIAPPVCDRLGVPLPFDTGAPALSAAAIADPPVYDRARAAARYTGSMRDLIQSFKYRDRHEGLPMFGRWLVPAGADILTDAELIVPVPLYPSRLWTRRFNQSALLSQRVSRLTGIPADCFVLQRVRRTASQVGLSPQQRQRNVAGAFKVNPKRMPRVSERHCCCRRCDHHRSDGRGVRQSTEACWRGAGGYSRAG